MENDVRLTDRLFSGPCDFIRGVSALDHLPPIDLPEIAFAGRSNVGKSSLLNALMGRKNLARTSNTPGRTQELNYFKLGDLFYLVDMPGYGYAKVSKTQVASWTTLIKAYLRGRASLRCVFVLVDSRHGLKASDQEMMSLLDQSGVSYRVILTKVDKLRAEKLADVKNTVESLLKKSPAAFPEALLTSSEKTIGIQDLREIVLGLRS